WETVPARKMLEKLRFECRDEVDPFDGGRILAAKMDGISVVKETRRGVLAEALAAGAAHGGGQFGFVSHLSAEGEFRAVQTEMMVDGKGKVGIGREVMSALGWQPGMEVGVTALEGAK